MFLAILADNQTLRVIEVAPIGMALREVAEFRNRAAACHERDLVTARPGRVFNRAAGTRQAYEPKTSAKQTLTRRWLKAVGVQVQSLLSERGVQALILVAAPRMLAEMRRALPASVLTQVRAQLARDLIHQPNMILRKRLQPCVRAAMRATALR